MCETCGGLDRRELLADDTRDQTLRDHVGAALAAQAALAWRTAAERGSRASDLRAEALVLRRRLSWQKSLLRGLSSPRRDLQSQVVEALASVDHVLHETTDDPVSTDGLLIDAELPRDRSCAIVARRLLEGHLAGILDHPALGDALLVASELANNAFLHGRGRIILQAGVRTGRLRIELHDEGRPKSIGIGGAGAAGGRGAGLRFVSHLAADWGADTPPARVWAELLVADTARVHDR